MSTSYDEFDSVWAPRNKAVDNRGATHDLVQDAVDNATEGGFVMIGAGRFEENVTGLPDNIGLRGAGPGTVLDGGEGTALTVDADNVNLKQFSVQNTAGAGNAADTIEVPLGNSGALIQFLRVVDSDAQGISVNGDRCSVMGCTVESADSTGIRFEGSSFDCVAMGNILSNMVGGLDADGQRIAFIGNVVQNPQDRGIIIDAPHNVVIGNNVRGAGNEGIHDVNNAGDDGPNIYIANIVTDCGTNFDLSNATSDSTAVGNVPAVDTLGVSAHSVNSESYSLYDYPDTFKGEFYYDPDTDSTYLVATDPDGDFQTYRSINHQSTSGPHFPKGITAPADPGMLIGDQPVPFSSEGVQYDLQKDGTDGAGIINFKTT